MIEPIVHELTLTGSPADVFTMFTDPNRLVKWLGISAELEPRLGGRFRFEVQPGEYCSGRYVEIDPPHRVAFTFGWESDEIPLPPGSSIVEVDLAPTAGGTLLRLTHRGLPTELGPIHVDGWTRFLQRLDDILAGRPPTPLPPAPPSEILRQRGTS